MAGFAAKSGLNFIGVMACGVALFAPSLASAAWLKYRNDTQQPIVVQTSIVVNNKVVLGKAHPLHPGESASDNIPSAGPQQISIMDPKNNNKVLLQQAVHVATQDIALGVQWQAQPQVQGKPPVPPALRLLPIKIIGPAGVVPPKTETPKETPKTGPNSPIPPRGPLPPTATPPADTPKSPPAEKPKMPPSGDQPKTPPPPAEKPKSPPPAEKPKTPPATDQPKTPAEQPKSKSGNDK